jgi:tetratricopeptide (TPR) repeat protein
MAKRILFYNPRAESHETLEAVFVGRGDIVDEVLADLARQAGAASRQHWLIRAPRGFGKTHFAGILYHRVRKHPQLGAAYLPVWLSETAAYEVYSAGTLLIAIAERLAEELRLAGDPGGDALENAVRGLDREGDDPCLFEEVCGLLKEEAHRQGRSLLVLMENLDALLQGFAPNRRGQEASRLRSLLLEDKEFLFISTTPTHYLSALSDPKAPLYGHLRERPLPELDEGQVGELLNRLAKLSGDAAIEQALSAGTDAALRRRVFRRLTGGSPRSVVLAFSAIRGATGIAGIAEELQHTLDAHTPYFESRLARLAPRERSIVSTLALAETGLTLLEVARETRLPSGSLSTQMNRLLKEGVVAREVEKGGKGDVYQISDELFRLWYRYRKGHRLLEPLIRFLAFWTPETDLVAVLESLEREDRAKLPFHERDLRAITETQLRAAIELARSPAGRLERERLWAECHAIGDTIASKEPTGAPTRAVDSAQRQLPDVLDELRALEVQSKLDAVVLDKWVELAEELIRLDGAAQALKSLESLARLTSEDPLTGQASIARILLIRGRALARLDRHDDAIDAFDELIRRFGDRPDLPLAEQVARALFYKGVSLGALARSLEAVEVYDDLLRRFDDRPELSFAEQVAKALFNKGFTFHVLDRRPEEVEVYDDLIRRFGDRPEQLLAAQVARALVNKGLTLDALHRTVEAVEVCDDVIRRFGHHPELPLTEQVAKALVSKGVMLNALDKNPEAIEVYDEVIHRFGNRPELSLAEGVVRALVNKGFTLDALDRTVEAVEVYDDVIRRFGDRPELPFAEGVARALVNKGMKLGNRDRGLEAVEVYDEVLRRFGDRPELPLAGQVARALVNKGFTLGALERSLEAVQVYEDVIRLFGDRLELPLAEGVARALVNKGFTLIALNRSLEAVEVYDDVVRRFGDRPELPLAEHVAIALVNKGFTLGALNRSLEAIEVYDDVVRRFGDRPELPFAKQVAMALANKGTRLGVLDRSLEAVEVYDEVIRRFGNRSELPLAEEIARALVNKGFRLGVLDKNLEAVEAYDEAIRRFGDRPDLPLAKAIAAAFVNKGFRLGVLDKNAEAVEVYDEAIRRFGDRSELPFVDQVARALLLKGFATETVGARAESLQTFRGLLARSRSLALNNGEWSAHLHVVGTHLLSLASSETEGLAIRKIIDDILDVLQVAVESGKANLGSDYITRTLLADLLMAANRRQPALRHVEIWLRKAPAAPEDQAPAIDQGLRRVLGFADLETVRVSLDEMRAASSPAIAEVARLFAHVVDVLLSATGQSSKPQKGPGTRRGAALKRVPRELRQTVDELTHALEKQRAALAGSSGPPRRRVRK